MANESGAWVEFVSGIQSVGRWSRETPDAVAVTDLGMRFTYRDLATLIVRTTKYLDAQGVRAGMLVGLECSIRYLHLALMMACERLGATTATFLVSELTAHNPLLPRCALLLSSEAVGGGLVNGLALTRDLWLAIEQTAVSEAELASLETEPQPVANLRIKATSGTTGSPKYMYTSTTSLRHVVQAWTDAAASMACGFNFISLYNFTMSVTQIASLVALNAGSTVSFSNRDGFSSDLANLKNAFTTLLPSEAAQLCDIFSGSGQTRCGAIMVGGHSSGPLRRRMLSTFATGIFNNYGLNECGIVAIIREDGAAEMSAGTEVRILSPDRKEVPIGDTGVIAVRNPGTVREYLWNTGMTAKHFADGWHITSDLGYLRSDGRLVLLGRVDDMLNIGGIKVPPESVEAEIKTLPDVRDAVLVSVEDQNGLDALHIFVELVVPAAPAALHGSIETIIFKMGCSFQAHYRTSLPRTQTGKVQRGSLKDMITGQMSG